MSLPQPPVGSFSLPKNIPDKDALLHQTYLEAFRKNFDSCQRWTRWKEDHEIVKSTLSSLPDKLSHEVVIPFGSKALMKAKLVHTNEVITCIGSSWFVKQSAKQGIEMCDRRIKQSEEMLMKLESEKTLLTDRQTFPKLQEAFPSDGTEEIVEEYNEEAETEWRRKHKEREAEYRRKLKELKKSQEGQTPVQTEEDIFRRLEELELEEELNDELERLHAEYEADYENSDEEDEEGTTDGEADEECDKNAREEGIRVEKDYTVVKPLQSPLVVEHGTLDGRSPIKIRKSSKDRDQADLDNCKDAFSAVPSREAWCENSPAELGSARKNRRISFADESCTSPPEEICPAYDENIYIRFKHTQQSSMNMPKKQSILNEDSPPLYNTPADICDNHKMHETIFQPKSILKKSSSFPERSQNFQKSAHTSAAFGSSLGFHFSDSDEEDSGDFHKRDLSHLPPVLCEVQESSGLAPQLNTKDNSSRPMSRFRSARQTSKKLET